MQSSVYLWAPHAPDAQLLFEPPEDSDVSITSIKWSTGSGPLQLAVGTQSGGILTIDSESNSIVHTLQVHSGRVDAICWNNALFASASQDKRVILSDTRQRLATVSVIKGHSEEVCGVAWSPDGMYLSTGGLDKQLNVWDVRQNERPVFSSSKHTSAVKAMDWSRTERNVLASGGGREDGKIRLWDIQRGREVSCIDTQSQVCTLLFSPTEFELLSTHGYPKPASKVWSVSMTGESRELGVLGTHTGRVLHSTLGADGKMVMTGGEDERICLWNVFRTSEEVHAEEQTRGEEEGTDFEKIGLWKSKYIAYR